LIKTQNAPAALGEVLRSGATHCAQAENDHIE
jgi:hypothetical protein